MRQLLHSAARSFTFHTACAPAFRPTYALKPRPHICTSLWPLIQNVHQNRYSFIFLYRSILSLGNQISSKKLNVQKCTVQHFERPHEAYDGSTVCGHVTSGWSHLLWWRSKAKKDDYRNLLFIIISRWSNLLLGSTQPTHKLNMIINFIYETMKAIYWIQF